MTLNVKNIFDIEQYIEHQVDIEQYIEHQNNFRHVT